MEALEDNYRTHTIYFCYRKKHILFINKNKYYFLVLLIIVVRRVPLIYICDPVFRININGGYDNNICIY